MLLLLLLLELLHLDVVPTEGHGRGMRLIRLSSCICGPSNGLLRHTRMAPGFCAPAHAGL